MFLSETMSRASAVSSAVMGRERLSVTDLSRSKDWRPRLTEVGVIEVTDRGDTAAWLVSDDDMKALVEACSHLEEELERAQIAAMFRERADSHPKTGEDLQVAALKAFESRKEELAKVVRGD